MLPDEVIFTLAKCLISCIQIWTGQQIYTVEDLATLTPFIDVWSILLPITLKGIASLHRSLVYFLDIDHMIVSGVQSFVI